MAAKKLANVELLCSAVSAIQRIGVCAEMVKEAVQSPDDIHKIVPDSDGFHHWPVISVYLKRLCVDGKESLLLVQGLKQRGAVAATAVWQVDPRSIGVELSASARDVFSGFIDKYGVQLRTSHGLTKLVTYQIVGSSTTTRHGKWEHTFHLPENVLGEEDHRVTDDPELCLSNWAKETNVKMHVAMFYRVNLSNYLHDLKHNQAICA